MTDLPLPMETVVMPEAGAFLLMLGAILYLGVIGTYLFEKFKVPDVLNLILIGLLLGPVLGVISPGFLAPWMPVVGAIALGLILFEGGLGLELSHIISRFGLAFLLATGTFMSTAALIAVIYHATAGGPWIHGLLMGTTLGCVSSAVILPISNLLTVPEKIKTTIHLEAALSDMWGVVLTLVLIRLAPSPTFAAGQAFNALVGAFSTAIFAGVAFGLAWLWALDRMKESQFSYMMTLAAVFVLYGLTELLHGSGPMAALTFGVVLTNADGLARLVKRKFKFVLNDKIRWFNTEVSFFARTFFFVYVGLVVSFHTLSPRFFAVVIALFSAILLCRYAVVHGITYFSKKESEFSGLYLAMLPRGLTSAVLVGMVQARVPDTDGFLEYAFAVILLTNILMTWWVWHDERKSSSKDAKPKKA